MNMDERETWHLYGDPAGQDIEWLRASGYDIEVSGPISVWVLLADGHRQKLPEGTTSITVFVTEGKDDLFLRLKFGEKIRKTSEACVDGSVWVAGLENWEF